MNLRVLFSHKSNNIDCRSALKVFNESNLLLNSAELRATPASVKNNIIGGWLVNRWIKYIDSKIDSSTILKESLR